MIQKDSTGGPVNRSPYEKQSTGVDITQGPVCEGIGDCSIRLRGGEGVAINLKRERTGDGLKLALNPFRSHVAIPEDVGDQIEQADAADQERGDKDQARKERLRIQALNRFKHKSVIGCFDAP